MSYLRSFHRKHERYQAQYDNQHLPDARLARKVLSAVTALSFLGNPFGALAATITDASGKPIDGSNGVYNIYAQKVHDKTGVNQFQDFKVNGNEIANMYFKQESGTAWVDNLVNFVDSRIDINGTVNAVKNNKIGGNLFFLSPDGMAVGKTGVINTGSLYVLAPARSMTTDTDEFSRRYEGLKGAFTSGSATADTLNSLKTLQIPLNASGTISILGQINAVGDVKLAAAKIGIGKNVSGEDLADGTKAGAVVNTAKIHTYDSFDFSNVVNITKADGTRIKAGLGNDLTATKSGNGDIVLTARAENANTWDEKFNSLGTYLGLPKVENGNKTIEASVEHYGTVEAAGDVSMTASVTNGNKDRAEELLEETTPAGVNIPDYVPVPAADASNYAQTKAAVTVSGDVTAKGDVELAAHADNTFVDDGTALTDNVSNVLSKINPMSANVMILDNSAQVTVSKDADITADGRIDVRADAVLDGTAGAAANGRKLIKKVPDAIPAASVGYARTTNEATVTIDGNLTAKGKNQADSEGKAVQVAAQAETNVTNAATLNVKGGVLGAGSPGVAAAVAVTESENDAVVKVNGTITATQGDADITAKTTNLINTSAAAKVPDGTVGSTAVNVTTHTGKADITINGDVTAQNVNIDATNYIDENTITANNALGLGKLMANAADSVMTAANVQGITNALKENPLVQKISNKDGQEADKPGLFKTLGEKLAVGAAVVVADETNTANVTFGKTADVEATAGDVKTDANVQVYDSHLFASGTANSYKKNEQGNTDAATVGAGVVYAGMKNDASVVVADGEGTGDEDKAQITAANDIIMTSKTTMEYHRPERLVREIERSIENLNYALAAIEGMDDSIKEQYKDIIDSLKKLETQLTEYAGTYTEEFMDTASNPDAVTAEGSLSSIMNAAAGSVSIYNTVADLQQQFGDLTDVASPFSAVVTNALGVVTGAIAFVKPENYANVAAAASAKGGEESTKLSLSGSVTVTDSAQNSGVIIGKNAVLNAGKNLNLQSSNVLEDVNVTGKTMFWTTSASAPGGVGVGGSVNYQGFDTSSKVQVSKGASLTAGDISLGSNSDVFHVGAMMSAGTSDGSAVSGMVAITDSDSVNDVLVDTDAVLTATTQDESKGTIDIAAKNDTNVTNAILSFSASGANVGAGLAAAVNNINVRNTAQIADQDTEEEEKDSKGTGKISAANLNVHAETTGLLNTVSVAGGVTSSGKDDEDPDKEEGLLDKIKAPFTKMEATKDQALGKLNQASGKLQDVLTQMNRNPGNTGTTSTPGGTPVEEPEAGVPYFTFAGAGSVSLNLVEDTTKTVIDGANIALNHDGKLTAGARDSAFIGAWSGAAGMSFRKGGGAAGGGAGSGTSGSGNTSVAAAGAVGVNTIDNTIAAIVQNSTITGAKNIDVQAVSGGTAVAAGLGLTVTSDSSSGVGNTNYSGGGSVSVNLINKNVKANMNDNTVTGAEGGNGADIDVTAYESDVQVTGGVNANIAAGGGSVVGAGVTVADINNAIDAGISGGTYTNIHDAKVQGMMAATQVTAALSVGVAAGGDSGSSNNAFTGAVVYNGLHNNVNAHIDKGANITASGTVSAAAKDTRAGSEDAQKYQDLLGDYKNHNSFASDRGIDTTGASYYKGESDADGLDTGDKKVNYDGNQGSIIVGAAAAIAGSDKNAGGAAVNIADIDNNFTASIDSATISADAVQASADADTLLVGASGGVAAGSKNFGAMGSVTWQDLNHDVTAKITNSTITAHAARADASSHSQSINVAGSVAAGKKAGIGAALAYNGLDNTVRAAMEGNTLKAHENGTIDVTVGAANTGSVLGVGVGVAAASKAAVNGSVAINRGGSNTEAVIDKSETKNSTITDAGAVKVTAEDRTERGAVVGSVSASSKAAVGGAVAYNDIGGSSADSNKAAQATTAAIRNTTIRTAQSGAKSVTVQADDASQLDTYAIGAAISAEAAAVQGSAATALINKKAEAVIEKSTITGENDKSAAGNVAVNTHNSSNIMSSASVAAVTGKGAGVGAGVAVNRIVQQTHAAVEGGKLNVGNLTVHADGTPTIKNIGIGVAVAGQGAGVAGSVAVNKIANNVTAHIGSGAAVTADGSVGVIATSDEQLANYAGQVAVAGQGAGVGMSVSVNEISGTTSATVGGEDEDKTTVTAKGNDSLTTKTAVADDQIHNTLIDEGTVAINNQINRTDETRSGLIVDASSTRDLKSFLLTAAVTGEGAAVPATVNVNKIAGATNAGIANAVINEGLQSSNHNVIVDAGDYTNSSGFVGSAGGGGIGAGVGLGSDTNLVSRDVSASVEDSDVTANAFDVTADSKQGVSSFTIGAGVAGIGGGVAGVVTVTDMNNTTKASVQGGTITAKTANITADHEGIVNAGNVGVGVGGVGAGAGLSVGVLKDSSATEVVVGDRTNEDHKTTITADEDLKVSAVNTTTVNPTVSATGIGAGGIAGATSVNNLNSTVKTTIANAALTSNTGNVTGEAKNTLNVDAYMGAQAAGGIGVGAGVTVNTIDSTVQLDVTDSTLTAAKDVSLTADEKRNIKQTATNVAVGGTGAAGVNIAVTTVGKAVEDEETKNKIAEANKVFGDTDLLAGAGSALGTAEIDNGTVTPTVDAGLGGGDKKSQITVNVTNSNVKADKKVTAQATETDNITMTLGGAAASGMTAVNAGVGILDVNRNVGVHLKGGKITAPTIDVGTDITGTAKLDVYQGSAGVYGLNAAVGKVTTGGLNAITLNGVTLTGKDVTVLAADHGGADVNVLGITGGLVSVGAIVAEAENASNTGVTMTETTASSSDDDDKESSISVKAEKANTVSAHATGGTGGVISGSAVVANASDSGTSSVILGNTDGKAGNTLSMDKITAAAVATPKVTAIADSVSIGFVGAAGASVAEAKASGQAITTVYDGNTLEGDTVEIRSDVGTQNADTPTVEARVEGNTGGKYVAMGANVATADVEMQSNVHVGDVTYKTKEEKTLISYEHKDYENEDGEPEAIYETTKVGATNLTISGTNTALAAADARGVTIGGLVSSGNNIAKTTNTAQTKVDLNSGEENTLLSSLQVTATGTGSNTTTADGSGGGLVSGDLAAYVNNTMEATTAITVGGTLTVDGDVRIGALQSDTANLHADALKATVVGASATKAENSITGTTSVTLDKANIDASGSLEATAANTVTMGNTEKYAVEGSGYGGVNVQGAEFDNTITKKAAVSVMGSTIQTDGSQAYEAKTAGDIMAGGYIKAAGGGAFTWVDMDNTVTSDNKVTVDEKSSLKTDKANADLTLAAADSMDVHVLGVADTQGGAIGGASSDVTNVLHRNNSISVAGDLYSMNDVNLYAGKDAAGREGRLDLVAESEAYNKSALAVSKPKLNDAVNQSNQVTVSQGSDVSSVRHINLYADAGKESIRDTSVKYTWYHSDKDETYTSSTVGDTAPANKTGNNFVRADGNLTAGVQNKLHLTIGGKNGQLVFFDDDVRNAVNAYGNGQMAVGRADLGLDNNGTNFNTNDIVTGTFDYATALFDRYNELDALVSAYSDNVDKKTEGSGSAAYYGYIAERDRIKTQLESMNLLQKIKDENGNVVKTEPVKGVSIDYIELPDLVASGGNITVQSDSLGGTGNLKAQGAPEVVITNNTNLYLKVNDITVGEAGGELQFNGQSLKGGKAEANEAIAKLNANTNVTASFADVQADAEVTKGGTLEITGNYSSGEVYANVTTGNTTEKISMTPRADIEINGIVDSKDGIVKVTSAANNIVIQGKTASESAGVKGKEVHLTAAGSVSQGFQDGIVSIGGDVQKQYAAEYEEQKKAFDEYYKDTYTKEDIKATYTSNNKPQSEGNRIAGESIYISASDININGTLQSGYADYTVTIDDTAQDRINKIQKNWTGGDLSDFQVTMGTAYRIVEGKDVLGEDGVYSRQLDVYYNPSTGQIVVPDVDAKGGHIYLTGRISSTGGGKINVLDGAYDITVTNNTNHDLQLGKLVSNDVEGKLAITDMGQNKVTEFTRNATVVKDLTGKEQSSIQGTPSSYKPEKGLRYNWTTGQNITETKEYSKTIKAGLWGLVETMNKEALQKHEQEIKPTVTEKGDPQAKPNGEYIGEVSGVNNNSQFTVIYENDVLENSRTDPTVERWSSGFLNWFKWEKYTWETKTGTSQQYMASVKADHEIGINFMGNVDGNSKIKVNSQGNINLTNTIGSAKEGTGSFISLSSTGGAIRQTGGSLTGDNIALSAAKGLKNISITSIGDTVNLNAVTTSGDAGITVKGAYGKAGNVSLDKLFAGTAEKQAGNVSLTADGNITQQGSGITVSGNRIDLVSQKGIGTDTQHLVINGGQTVVDGTDSLSASVNALAKKDIYLTQEKGDLRAGRIYSNDGDVTINVTNGSLFDALPDGETIDRGNTEELIQKWKDLGLIEGEGEYTKRQKEDINAYKEGVQAAYAKYAELKKSYEEKGNALPDDQKQAYTEAYKKYSEAKEQYDSLKQAYEAYQNGKKLYADDAKPQRDNYLDETSYNKALESYTQGKAQFDSTKDQFTSYDTNEDPLTNLTAYIKAKMGEDSYKTYTEPTVTITVTENDKTVQKTMQMKSAFDDYASYQNLQNTYGSYESADAYMQGNEGAAAHLAALEASAQWSQDQLLYAIQDSIINPSSTTTENIVKDPNLKGKNITVTAIGSVGRNSEDVTTIQLADLSSDVEALKKLANANAASVTWDEENGKATIQEKVPVGVQLTGKDGKLNIKAGDNVYLSGRTEIQTESQADVDNVLNIELVQGTGNIRLQGKNGIFNARSDDQAAISGMNLLLQGGDGGLGTADRSLTLDLTGAVQATAGGGIYLDQLAEDNNLEIYSMSAGGDIVLTAKQSIVSTDNPVSSEEAEKEQEEQQTKATGYIRSDKGTITLNAGGSVGTAEAAVRILNVADEASGQTVTVTAGKDVYLKGISMTTQSDAPAEGTLFLNSVSANGTIQVDGNGTVQVGNAMTNNGSGTKITAATDVVVNGDMTDTGTITLKADKGIALESGTLQAAEAVLHAGTAITQKDAHSITANTVSLSSTGNQNLTSSGNTFQNVTVHGLEDNNSLTGNIALVSKADSLTANLNGITVKNGSISVQHTGDGTLTTEGAATTQKSDSDNNNADIILTSAGSVVNDGALTSADSVTIQAETGITANNAITAGTTAKLTTADGDIHVNGAVDTQTGATVQATNSGSITITGDVRANKSGNVAVTTEDGNVTISGNAISKADNVLVQSEQGGNVAITGSLEAGKNVTASANGGNVTIGTENKDGLVQAGANAILMATGGSVHVFGSVSGKQSVQASSANGGITINGTAQSEQGSVSLDADGGDVNVTGSVTGGTSVTANATNGSILINGEAEAKNGSVSLTASDDQNDDDKGNITVDGTLTASDAVTVKTDNGVITIGKDGTSSQITAGTIVELTTTAGDIHVNGAVDTKQGATVKASNSGSITIAGNVQASDSGDVALTTKQGDIKVTGSLNAAKGAVTAETTNGAIAIHGTADSGTNTSLTTKAEGDISVGGTITAGQNVTTNTQTGTITLGGKVTAVEGQISSSVAKKGDINLKGDLLAKTDVIQSAQNGSITFAGNTEAQTGKVSAATSGEGNISFGGTVKAGTDISAVTNTNGNIVFNGAVNAGRDIMAHAANNGGITIRQDVTAGQGLTLQTNNGNILFDNPNNVSEEITATAENGDVTVSITGDGKLTDTRHEPNGDKGNLRADNGNVTITHSGHGDVDLYEVYAKEDNRITVTDGDLHLVNASGSLVALLVKNAEKDLDVKTVEAAQKIEISGSDIDLDNITQREDGNGYLIITPQGASEDKPIDNLVMGNITTNTGVRFDKLWLNTGEINVTGGALLLDKVYVQDKAVFTNGAMKTHVFGRAPEWDASADSSYWIDTDKNRPQDNLEAWKNGSGDWMYLHFLPQDRVQYSNGNLLHLAEHHDVFSQRYAQTSWMQHVTSPSFHDFYTKYYTPDLTYHDRYLLIDHEEADVINAPSEHIVVE